MQTKTYSLDACSTLINLAMRNLSNKISDLSRNDWIPIKLSGCHVDDDGVCANVSIRLDGIFEHIDVPDSIECVNCNVPVLTDETDIIKVRIVKNEILECIGVTECPMCDKKLYVRYLDRRWFTENYYMVAG